MKEAAITTDTETRRLLRALGEAALALADGRPLDDSWLPSQVPAEPGSDVTRTPLLTVSEACERLRISRWSFYRLVQQNQLTSVTIGRRRLIPQTEISRFLASLSGAGAPS